MRVVVPMGEGRVESGWWHVFGGESDKFGGCIGLSVVGGPGTVPPSEIDDEIRNEGIGGLPYITSVDHEPTEAERSAWIRALIAGDPGSSSTTADDDDGARPTTCAYCGEEISGGPGGWYDLANRMEVCPSGQSPTSFHEPGSDEMHYMDCGIAGGMPHPASAHFSSPTHTDQEMEAAARVICLRSSHGSHSAQALGPCDYCKTTARDALRAADAVDSTHLRVLDLESALWDARAEIDRWGRGDFHYGSMPRDPGVVAALERIDAVLGTPATTEA